MWSCWKWQNIARGIEKFRFEYSFEGKDGFENVSISILSLPCVSLPRIRRGATRRILVALWFIKFQNSDPLCSPWISRKEILSVSPAKTGAQCRRKRTRKHGIFEIQLRLVDFSFLSLSLSFSFVRLRTTYKKKGKKKKKLFRLFRQKFSTKYFSRHDGCLVSPVVRKGFSVAGSGNERNGGTGRRSSSSNWFKLVAGTIPVLLQHEYTSFADASSCSYAE